MAHTHDHGTTVVEDTSSSSLLAVILIVALVALLVWFIGFSGIVIDRDNDTAPADSDRTEIREETDSDTTIIQPGTGTETNQPAQSPAP